MNINSTYIAVIDSSKLIGKIYLDLFKLYWICLY